ncbi:sensor histidine kinase [Agromyces archimandritae]|uniref:histidine kinase n=1 Tax=Agromyces archimandritae TaxID=2781962 RepID=A0A975IRG7_9MICO|nr:sensor histidine kinase [Agromyces archimandritae]
MPRSQLVVDLVLAGVFALVCLPFSLHASAAGLLPLVAYTAALGVRRLRPDLSLALAWAGALLTMGLMLPPALADSAVLGVLYASSAHGSRRVRWAGLASAVLGAVAAAVYLGVVQLGLVTDGAPQSGLGMLMWGTLVFIASVSLFALAWTAGLVVRTVRASRAAKRNEELARRDRTLAEYRMVVEQERSRIARDMHDVVAHSLAVVIAQADGARFAAAAKPEAAVDALGTIAGVARGALGDVRMLLAELRHDEGGAPQPVIEDLELLLDQLRAAGLDVRAETHGDPVELPTGHQIAVYRIVQEALTNALRHGDTEEPVELRFDWDGAGVSVTVASALKEDGRQPGPPGALRHGIPGMRERAQLTGGTLHAEPAGGRFVVRARIPARSGRQPA